MKNLYHVIILKRDNSRFSEYVSADSHTDALSKSFLKAKLVGEPFVVSAALMTENNEPTGVGHLVES